VVMTAGLCHAEFICHILLKVLLPCDTGYRSPSR
jgi:hypothetical protein